MLSQFTQNIEYTLDEDPFPNILFCATNGYTSKFNESKTRIRKEIYDLHAIHFNISLIGLWVNETGPPGPVKFSSKEVFCTCTSVYAVVLSRCSLLAQQVYAAVKSLLRV